MVSRLRASSPLLAYLTSLTALLQIAQVALHGCIVMGFMHSLQWVLASNQQIHVAADCNYDMVGMDCHTPHFIAARHGW